MEGTEQLEKRFGAIAMAKGFIILEQFMEAMRIQVKEEMELAKHRHIGKILIELEDMSTLQIKEVLDEMGKQDKVQPELIQGEDV